MPDWKKIVREKLGTLPLTNGRRDEVIEELAQQLESAYEEALAQGINEQEAMRRSLAQFKDWEKLRHEVFQSVEGAHLPVWEQSGFFAPRRLPVWIALGVSLLLLALPTSRQALEILPVPGSYPDPLSPQIFSDKALSRIEQSGDKEKYARALAFVAFHSSNDLRAMHAAEKAIALDPRLTWISAKVSGATNVLHPSYDPHPWIERLKAWDPQNGFAYMLEADANVHYWEPPWSKYGGAPLPDLRSTLATEPSWRLPMDKAFAAPRLDFYEAQLFALNRQVLQEQAFDRPDMLLAAEWSQPVPSLSTINFYEEIQLQDIGEAAERAGRTDEALAAYWSVVHFGERLGASSMGIAQIISNKLRRDAYKRLVPLLRSKGRAGEAAAIESALAALPPFDYSFVRPGYLSVEATARRSARVIVISAVFVAVLGAATVLWLIFVIALKWNADSSRPLNRLASPLCLASPALLLASIALFLGFYPYARSIAQFHSYKELEYGYAPVLMGVYDVMRFGNLYDVWLTQMFWPVVWCAVVAFLGAGTLWWVRSRPHPDNPDAA